MGFVATDASWQMATAGLNGNPGTLCERTPPQTRLARDHVGVPFLFRRPASGTAGFDGAGQSAVELRVIRGARPVQEEG